MRGRSAALALALALALTACGPAEEVTPSPSAPAPSASPSPARAERRDFTLPLEPGGGWDPYVGSRSSNMSLTPLLYEGLYALDNTFTPQPVLAREATPSEDGLTWTVRLRAGVTFSDGTPLDASAAARAVNLARGEKSLYASRLKQVTQVTGEGDALVFTLKAPNTRFPALLDFPLALVDGEEVYGTGPYVLTGESLTARSGWWRGLELPVEEILLKPVHSADQLVDDFDAGTLSLVAADPTGPDALGYAGSHQTWEYPTSTMLYLGFQCGKGPCRDREVRRALSLALPRAELVNQAMGGHASIAALPLPPTSPDYDQTQAAQLGHDPLAAQEILDTLGYERGEDDTRRKGRTELSLTLIVNSDNGCKAAAAQAIAAGLEEIGAAVTVEVLPWKDYQKALAAGQFDLYLGESRLTGDMDLTGFFTPGSGLSYGGCGSPELTQALAQARATGEWEEFFQLWGQEAPMAVLCFKTASLLTQWGQVAGARPTQNDLFYQFQDWKIG